jgi:hypothetical protein
MTAFPSAAPTVTPNNDFCDEALVVTGDSSVYDGSLVNTTIETRFSCSMKVEIQQRGRWYEYPGNGLRLTVSLLSASVDETQVEVFTGDSCGELVYAETSLLKTVDVPTSDPESSVCFPTDENMTYHILVFSYSALNASTSDRTYQYNLRISDDSVCGNAYPIDLGLGESKTLHLGSTAAATVRDCAPECGSATLSSSPGVWYTIICRSLNIEASNCSKLLLTLRFPSVPVVAAIILNASLGTMTHAELRALCCDSLVLVVGLQGWVTVPCLSSHVYHHVFLAIALV